MYGGRGDCTRPPPCTPPPLSPTGCCTVEKMVNFLGTTNFGRLLPAETKGAFFSMFFTYMEACFVLEGRGGVYRSPPPLLLVILMAYICAVYPGTVNIVNCDPGDGS